LFWRNRKNDEITLELNTSDRRNGVRIHPLQLINIRHENEVYQLIDISTCGMAFKADKFSKNDGLDVTVPLPLVKGEVELLINCQVKVIDVVNNICHCDFKFLPSDEHALLDKYILDEQKRQIRLVMKHH
jgi:PilZ domain